jgi:hypothetical protein
MWSLAYNGRLETREAVRYRERRAKEEADKRAAEAARAELEEAERVRIEEEARRRSRSCLQRFRVASTNWLGLRLERNVDRRCVRRIA